MKNRKIYRVAFILAAIVVTVVSGVGDASGGVEIIDLGTPGGETSYAININDYGEIVGAGDDADGISQPVIWRVGDMKLIEGLPVGDQSYVHGINTHGEIVGYGIGIDGVHEPFITFDGDYSKLGCFGGMYGRAFDINEAGQVAGMSYDSLGNLQGFVLSPLDTDDDGLPDTWFTDSDGDGANDLMQAIPTLGGSWSIAYGLNGHGHAVGYSHVNHWYSNAFVWDGEAIHDMDRLASFSSVAKNINNFDQVTGYTYINFRNRHAFIVLPLDADADGKPDTWFYDGNEDMLNDLMLDLGTLGGHNSYGMDINDKGQIAGYAQDVEGVYNAFLINPLDTDGDGRPDLWFRDTDADGANDLMLVLPPIDGQESYAYALNRYGHVVGESTDALGNFRATLWVSVSGGDIIAPVRELLSELQAKGSLNAGEVRSLMAPLKAGIKKYEIGKYKMACDTFSAFSSQVRAKVQGGKLTQEEGHLLTVNVENIGSCW